MNASDTILGNIIGIDGICGAEIGDIVIISIRNDYNITGRIITIDGAHIIAELPASVNIAEIIDDVAGKIITIERGGRQIISDQIEKGIKGSGTVEAVVKAAGHPIQP